MAAVIALGLLAATACGGGGDPSSGPPAPVRTGQVTVDGVGRNYRLYVPSTLDQTRPVPLLMVLHGGANTVDDAVKTMGFDQGTAGEYIVVYPEGTRREWNAGSCCGSAPSRKPDDVGFLTQVLDRVEADHRIDPARVFVVGVSNGAMMAYRLACERADRVTAVASVAGAVVVDDCRPSRPVSVVEIHGTEDQLVPYLGGQAAAVEAQGAPAYTATPAMVRRWAEVDGCPAPLPVVTTGPMTTEAWTGCAKGSEVKLITIQGGGHVWFASGLGPANGATDATGQILRFLVTLRPAP